MQAKPDQVDARQTAQLVADEGQQIGHEEPERPALRPRHQHLEALDEIRQVPVHRLRDEPVVVLIQPESLEVPELREPRQQRQQHQAGQPLVTQKPGAQRRHAAAESLCRGSRRRWRERRLAHQTARATMATFQAVSLGSVSIRGKQPRRTSSSPAPFSRSSSSSGKK